MFDNPLLKSFMDKYGHIENVEQLKKAMRRDGLGEMVDIVNDEMVDAFTKEHHEELEQSRKKYFGSGTVGKSGPIESLPVDINGTFKFDPQKCLTSCGGACCKCRDILMISYSDIFQILSSPYARHAKILTTRDLFESKTNIIKSFYNEEYSLYLPYLCFIPESAKQDSLTEYAENHRCPFLFPMKEVYSFHKLNTPEHMGKEAMGCILMNHKPSICKISPVGQNRGMITGKVSYEYTKPAKNCPACATNIEIPLNSYLKSITSYTKEEEILLFHKILIANKVRHDGGDDQRRFNSVLLEFYNVDRLLETYGCSPEKRPKYGQLVEILIEAANGNFNLYENFIQGLASQKVAKFKTVQGSDLNEHQKLVASESEEDHIRILYYIELAVTQIYKKNPQLTDRIVFNVLNEIVCKKENKSFGVVYLDPVEDKLHRELLDKINTSDLDSKCPQRILINGFKQVKNSVQSFIKRGKGKDVYLKFVVGYF